VKLVEYLPAHIKDCMDASHLLMLVGILLILGLVIFGAWYLSHSASGTPNEPIVCSTPDCLGKTTDCTITNPETLRKCVPKYDKDGQETACYECFGNSICQTIDRHKFFIDVRNLPGGICSAPYELLDPSDPNSACSLPAGTWCLPYIIPEIECNPFTGRLVLGKVSEHAPYEWLCLCVDDTKFTNDGNPLSNCDHIRVCAMDGCTNDDSSPRCVSSNRHLIHQNTGKLWTGNSTWDPFEEGICACNSDAGEFEGPNMSCITSACNPNGTPDPSDPESCICSPGYVSCGGKNGLGNRALGFCPTPSCVPDPCYPGHYSPSANNGAGGCDCSGFPGYIPEPVIQSLAGEMCINWCLSGRNPCQGRGECIVNEGSEADIALSFTFSYAQDRKTWFIYSNNHGSNGSEKTTYYLSLNSDKVILTPNGSNTIWTIETDCGSDSCGIVTTPLVTNTRYWLRSGNNYIYLSSSGKFQTIQKKTDGSPWQYVALKEANQGEILLDSTLYLAVVYNGANPSLTVLSSTIGIPTCKNCIVPFSQGPQGICEIPCLSAGEHPFGKSNCCSCQNRGCNNDAWGCVDTPEEQNEANYQHMFPSLYYCKGGNPGEISVYSGVTGCQ
jgi:hypothetical protein